jgi:multimeric flavodoxin WrbA
MKVTVINGGIRRGSTWHCKEIFLRELSAYEELSLQEFFLPKDMPDQCLGCFSCFLKGEHNCSHAGKMEPILKAMKEADLIVMTSPVYGLDVSGSLKVLLDHLCFLWITHRPDPSMFHKLGLAITTTAGAGLNHTVKTMRNSMFFWGMKKIFSFKRRVDARKWEDVTDKRKDKIHKDIMKMARKIFKAYKNEKRRPYPLVKKFMFKMMRRMMKKNTYYPYDRNYWEQQGWFGKNRPF